MGQGQTLKEGKVGGKRSTEWEIAIECENDLKQSLICFRLINVQYHLHSEYPLRNKSVAGRVYQLYL